MCSSPFSIRPFASESEQNSAIEALLPYLENKRQELLFQYSHYMEMHKQGYFDDEMMEGREDVEMIRDMHMTLSESDAEQKRKDLELIDSV